ncbi:MAG: type II toxin-antitoxin system RelE/ParE family toxin [Actinomycetota bacterium]
MRFLVEFTDVAEMEVQDTFLWLLGRSPLQAGRWQSGLEQAFDSLEQLPARCPLAPEDSAFDVEVRQLLYASYRILFTLVDGDDDGVADTVRVLHVRHGARRWLDDPGSAPDR